jgi:diguanylate cyclase (GGDEF)-like protein
MNLERLRPHLASARPRAASEPPGRVRAALIGGLIVLLGLAASAFVAAEWRSNALHTDSRSFDSTASDLSATLASRLEANISLTRTMRAIAAMEPNASDTRYQQWYRQLLRGQPASPGGVAALIQPVPASGLAAFRREAEAHPLLPGVGRSPYSALIQAGTDTGTVVVHAVSGSGGSLVALGAAVYRRGAPIATVSARRAALTGFVATTFDSATLIRSLLAGYRSLAMALYHENTGGPLQLISRAGTTTGDTSPVYSKRSELGEGWLVAVTGTADRPASADTESLFVLGAGMVATVLVLLLYRMLARSRRRAWGLVGEKTDELAYRALHDPLTDLPNRILVLDRAEQILARARRLDVPVTALFMDIDGFKQINDRYGRQTGDEVLRHVGMRLKTALRENDTVGRLGGDDFVLLVDSVGLDAAPELVAERILDVLRQPIELPNRTRQVISLTASVGIVTGRPASAEDLMRDADLALSKAKAIGKDGYVRFESAMHTAAQDRIHLEMDLAGALEANQFFLVYQPMLDLQSEQIVGVEALLRWRHPTSGVISPSGFVPIAEEIGLIVAIGRWALEHACIQCAAWRKRGYALDISVNVSARQLERTEFVEELRTALQDSDLDPAALTLEITETVLMREPDATALLLTELKALGVRIAVDDFGTGYSSLAYLRQFPVDSLKIDRTFITGLALSSEAHALTHTLIQLGKALGLETLAEGVEHHSQVRELRREGCDLAQGFLFARPLAADAIERLLRDSPRAVSHAVPSS